MCYRSNIYRYTYYLIEHQNGMISINKSVHREKHIQGVPNLVKNLEKLKF